IAAIVFAISCFNGWEGGYTTGARYLIIALPFFGLLLPPLTSLAAPARSLFVVLALASSLNMLVIDSTTPMLPPQPNPLYETAYGDFMNGAFFARKDPMRFFGGMPSAEQRAYYLAYNLGMALFRLRGFLSLAPFFALLLPGSIWL